MKSFKSEVTIKLEIKVKTRAVLQSLGGFIIYVNTKNKCYTEKNINNELDKH